MLAVVREFVKHQVAHGQLDARVLAVLYEVGDDRYLPAELRAEDGGLRYCVRPRHKLRAERPGRERAATQQEWEALLQAASCWRNRFLLVLLWFSGLRIGEALGLRRSDLHLMESAAALGCQTTGAHLHVVPRENANGARAKGRRGRMVPLAHHVVSYYDLYLDERERCRPAGDCDFVLVNLFAEPLGAPMRYSRVAQLFAALSRRAGLARAVTPHMLRHAAARAGRRAAAGVALRRPQRAGRQGALGVPARPAGRDRRAPAHPHQRATARRFADRPAQGRVDR